MRHAHDMYLIFYKFLVSIPTHIHPKPWHSWHTLESVTLPTLTESVTTQNGLPFVG